MAVALDQERSLPSLKTLAVAGLLTAIGIGYIGPVNAYLDQKAELGRERLRLAELERERGRVSGLIEALDQPAVLEARARELGLVRPNELPFVVSGLGPSSAGGGDDAGGSERRPDGGR